MDESTKLYDTGEVAPYGNYACTGANCIDSDDPTLYFVTDDYDELPECPLCGWTHWLKF